VLKSKNGKSFVSVKFSDL
jgi:hypothetical protein